MLRKRNKRGSLLDIMFIMIVILVFAVIILITFKITSSINDMVADIPGITAEATASTQAITDHYSGVVDNSFLLLTMGLGIASLALAALVRVHPIFIPIFIIALIGLIFISGIVSNIYQEMAEETTLQTEADQLTFISLILNILPMVVGVFGTLMMIVMYKVRDYAT